MTLPTALAKGAVTADTAATAKGLPAITKLVATGARPTSLRKKMGKNLMVMPDAKPKTRSDVARSQGTDAVLSRSLDEMLLLVCLFVGVCWSSSPAQIQS